MIQVRILDNPKLIEDACALLYEEYCKKGGWQFSENNPSELKIINQNDKTVLVDRITEHAIWFGAFDDNKLIGCIRCFKATKNTLFEISKYKTAEDIVKKYINPNLPNIYEGSRACVSSEYKGQNIIIMLYLNMLEYIKQAQASVFGSASNGYIKSILKRIEWPCKKEDAFWFEDTDSSPVNFYLANYKNGEVSNIIKNLRLFKVSKKNDTVDMFKSLNLIATMFPAPIYWHDIQGVVLGANSLCLNAMKKSKEEVVGKTPYDFYPKAIADHIWQHSQQVIKNEEISSQEEYVYDEAGKCIATYLAIKSPLYNEGGDLIGIIGTSVNITAQKESEALKLENEKLQTEKQAQKKLTGLIDTIVNAVQNYKLDMVDGKNKIENLNELLYRRIRLSKREEEVLYLLSIGKLPKDIARILGNLYGKPLSPKTVASVINKQLYSKLNATNYSDLIDKATKLHLIKFMPDTMVDAFTNKLNTL